MTPRDLFAAVIAPALASVLVFALAHQPWRREAPWTPGLRAALGAIAVGGALTLGFVLLGLWQGPWPTDATRRIPAVAIAVVVGEIAARFARRRWIAAAARVGAVALILWALAHPVLRNQPLAQRALLRLPGLGLAILAWWTLLARLAPTRPGACYPIILWLTASAASMLLVYGGHVATHGLLAASIAGSIGPLFVFAWIRPRITPDGASGVAAGLLASLLLIGHLFGSLAPWMIALVALAPLAVVLRRVPPIARLRPCAATLVCVLAAGALALPPVIIAYRAYDL